MRTTMSSITPLLLTLILLAASTAATSDSPSVYEVLESYDFPVGLLPKGVTSYELDSSTGKFAVYLNDTCSFTIEGYHLKYKTKVTGTISKDRIKDLKGIQVKVLFFWLDIVGVSRDGDDLEFSVGIVSVDFPVDNFYESPQCGCGFDCNNIAAGERSFGTRFGFKRLAPLLEVHM